MPIGTLSKESQSAVNPTSLLIGSRQNSFGSGTRRSHNPNRLSDYSGSEYYGVAILQIEEATMDAENEEDTPLKVKSPQ